MTALTLELSSPAETRCVGMALGAGLPADAIVLFAGDMGAGKTTLIKAICEGLGIAPQQVISPTYTLVNVYPGARPVYHVDLFRLEQPEALLELDPYDWVNPDGPTLLEWPEAARPLLEGRATLEARLEGEAAGPEARRLILNDATGHYASALTALERLAPVEPHTSEERSR